MHQDIITAMDENRINEKKYVYPYPETDIESTKKLDETVKEIKKQELSKHREIKDLKTKRRILAKFGE